MMTSRLDFMVILASLLLLYSCVKDTHGSTQYPPEFPSDQARGMYIDVYENWEKGHYLRAINAWDRNGDNVILSVANGETGELIYLNQTKFGSNASADLYLNQKLDRDHNPSTRTLKFKASDNISERATIITATLNIRDVNDEIPKFNLPSYQFSISENTPPSNSNVFNKILVTDADTGLNQRFNLYIEPFGQSSSNFKDVFLIRQKSNGAGNSTGEILLNKPLDYETLTFYQYTIKAVDQGQPANTGIATLIIKVTDFQDTPPFFQSLPYMKEIKENASLEETVLRVQAEDGDRGVPNPISYSLSNDGNCTAFFNINSSTGVVTVAEALDRDAGVIRDLNGVCRLTVKASEINNTNGNSTTTTPMTITIQDVNDNKPLFEETTYWAEVRENLTNIPITIINHTGIHIKDIDQGLFSQFDVEIYINSSLYRMLSPIPHSIISDGEIRIQLNNQSFDYEVEHRVEFQVVAKENSDRTHTSTCTVYLDIIDTNDNSPVFLKSSYNVTIDEGSENSSHVVNITATDADSGKYGQIHYELRNGGQQFVIDSKTGVIRTNCDPAELDFEKRNVYYLTVEALDGGGGRTPTSVIINLRDKNDNPPVFISNRYEVTVKEGEHNFSTNPFIIKATDRDEPGTNNSVFKYRLNIDDDLKSNFTINSTTGEISLNGTLDYEKIDFKKLRQPASRIVFYALAEDLGTQPLSSNTTIVINVQDVNDNTPKFNQSLYNTSFKEGKCEGLNLTTVFAIDDDASSPNNDTSYYISKGGFDRFFIDSQTGIISTSNFNFDRETLDTYNLTVIARDLGSPSETGTTQVLIKLDDVNDHRPFFSKNNFHENVLENATVNTTIVTCSASDPDIDNNLVYSVIDIKASDEKSAPVNVSLVEHYFDIDSSTGNIYVESNLDRETAETITLTILVNDTEAVVNAPQNDTAIVSITLRDINDNAPEFTKNVYRSNVRESPNHGQIVITVTATDKDVNNHISYSIYKNCKDGFSIDNNTGIITVSREDQLDREDQPQMNITVMANDGLKNSTAVVVVDLIDINDNAPAFVPTNQSFEIKEDNYNFTFLHQFIAVDNDTGMNANLTYYIENQTPPLPFHIDKYLGNLTINGDLDREKLNHYTLVLLCKDNPELETTQKTGTVTISIKVLDVNDNYPQFGKQTYKANLTEESKEGRIVVTVEASDKDDGQNGEVYYNISSSNASYFFSIDSKTGVIQVNNSLLDHADIYLLNVTAEDKGVPPKQNFTEVIITVTDANNHAPEFPEGNIESSIYECARNGTSVAHVTATDKDKAPNNKRISYKILNSSMYHPFPFSIDRDTGIIHVSGALKANITDLYRLKVNASDNGDPKKSTISEDIIINIKDVNDNPPQFDKTQYGTQISEESTHENFYTVVAVDIDKDSNTTYTLEHNAYNFSINEVTGQLSLNSPIDRETTSQVTLKVHARDSTIVTNYSSQCDDKSQQTQFNTTTTNIIVTIWDINDNPPVFKYKQLTVGIRRDLKQGSEIHDFKNDVTDLDIGENAVHEFKRIGLLQASSDLKEQILNPKNNCPGNKEKAVLCVSGNGSVTLNMVLSANAKGKISLSVLVKDAAGNDTSELEIFIVGDSQTLQMTIFASKDEVSRIKADIMSELERVLKKYKFISHDVQPYVSADGKRDDFRTNLLFHVQDFETQRILSAEEAKSLIDSNAGSLAFLQNKYRVIKVEELQLQQTSDNTEQLKQTYVLIAIIALLGGVVLVLGYFLCNTISKYKRRLKAATIKTIDQKKDLDVIPGSNEFAAKVNPLLNKEVKQNEMIPDDNESQNSLDVNEVDYSNKVIKNKEMEEKEAIMEMYGDDYFKPDDDLDPIQLALNEHNKRLTDNYRSSLLQNADLGDIENGHDNPVIYQQLETTEV